MISNILREADWLNAENNFGYGLLPIPNSRDRQIMQLLQTWLSFDASDRLVAASCISDKQEPTLAAFSERAASMAVRQGNCDLVQLGLVAIGLTRWDRDPRDNQIILSLLHDAANVLSLDAGKLFDDAALIVPAEAGRQLRLFAKRAEIDKNLENMGCIQGHDGDGFRYQHVSSWGPS